MSLLVDVSITAASIVEAAWARAVANRERLARRMDIQSTREEAARDKRRNIPWEQLYTTPTPTLYKPDEPVAHPFADRGFPVAYGWAEFINTGDPTYSPRIYSADRSVSLTFEVQNLPAIGAEFSNQDGSFDVTTAAISPAYPTPNQDVNAIFIDQTNETPGATAATASFTDQDVPGGNKLARINGTSTEIREQYNSRRRAEAGAFAEFCFPVDSARGLFVYIFYRHVKSAVSEVTRYRTRSFSYSASATTDGFGNQFITGTATMATFNSLPAPVTTIEYRSVEVAFLVGKTTIKQIGFPAGLKAVLDVTSPIQQIDQEGVWLTSTAIGTRPNSQLQGGTSSPTFTNNPGVFVPFAYKYGIVQATLPQSMPLSTFEGMTTTAGVYKALTITPDSPQATISSLADLDAFFAADTSVPRKPGSLAFCALGETCGTGFYGMDFIKVVPPTGDITGFTAERRNRITFNANNESEGTGLLTSWDWGQPAYCRAQLAALGFSPADLTP